MCSDFSMILQKSNFLLISLHEKLDKVLPYKCNIAILTLDESKEIFVRVAYLTIVATKTTVR